MGSLPSQRCIFQFLLEGTIWSRVALSEEIFRTLVIAIEGAPQKVLIRDSHVVLRKLFSYQEVEELLGLVHRVPFLHELLSR